MRKPSLRLGVGIGVLVLAFVEVHALVEGLRSQERLRGRIVADVQASLAKATADVREALGRPGADAPFLACRAAVRRTLSTEAELFDASGRSLAAFPRAPASSHWPPPADLKAVVNGAVTSYGPLAGAEGRLLTYTGLVTSRGPVILRLSTPVPELIEELRARRGLLLGNGLVLVVLALAAGFALLPSRPQPAASLPRAMEAYEQAMEWLRESGRARQQEHEQERRRMEDEIRDKEALSRAGELTAGIAHEVRNGLATILGYARLLPEAPESPTAEAARAIRSECETLEGVVRRFMDYVKRETLTLAPFDLGRMLDRVAARESRSREGASVETPGPGATLVGDEDLLERAFENLVRNAREAAGLGGKVSVRVGQDGPDLVVAVSDDGPGLAEAERESLRPFRSTKAGGLGLGLPIALKIVRLHGGDLRLAPRAPHGLEVEVRLPAAGPSADRDRYDS